jgi:putative hemolysin
MNVVNLEILLILLLIAANGVLAMSEIALVSARAARLEPLARAGDVRAATVLDLIKEPGTFFSTVQIGVTLIGILVGVFSGATVAQVLSNQLAAVPLLAPYSQVIAIGLVVLATTYLSLVLGELVPKRLALRHAEAISMSVALPIRWLSRAAYPFVRLLDLSTQAILRLLRVPVHHEAAISEDDVRFMLRQGTELGIFEPLEHDMVGRVFRLADQNMGALLTPRTEVYWLEVRDTPEEIQRKVVESGRSRFPVAQGDLDKVIGVALAKDMLAQCMRGEAIDLQAILRPVVFVPETAPALAVIEKMKVSQTKIAMVIDEYGGLAGLVTVDDIMGAIVGEIVETDEVAEPLAVRRPDGSWLIDGMMTTAEFCELFKLEDVDADRSYVTVGGLVMTILGKIPQTGDASTWMGLSLEVMDMDGRRVDKVLVRPSNPETAGIEGDAENHVESD